jgi:glycerophosphoryl diester phosphodiesterase
MALISAHRCGAGAQVQFDNTRAGVRHALDGDAEYVEFDVQRCADGSLVLGHDDSVAQDGRLVPIELLTRAELELAAGDTCSLVEALELLAGHKRAHIDLKFTSADALYATPGSTDEVRAAQIAQSMMGDGGFIITSLEDRSVRAVRDWADEQGVSIPVGLSLGRGLAEVPWTARPGVRWGELFPARRIRASRANLVVAHRRLARWGVARWSARHELPLLVWTVDAPATLSRWLTDPRVWMVTTNEPHLAAQIRDRAHVDVPR